MRKIISLIKSLYFGVINTILFQDYKFLTSCVITRHVPSTTHFPHPVGIIIGRPPGTKIGENCTILQNVTIGIKNLGDTKGPKIGDNVIIGCGACVLGDITIGDNVTIGANSVVTKSIPANVTVVGAPANIIKRSNDTK